jgi:hypothetical protein
LRRHAQHQRLSRPETRRSEKNKRKAYTGKSITVFDNRAICAHAGHCTDGLKEVFGGRHALDRSGRRRGREDHRDHREVSLGRVELRHRREGSRRSPGLPPCITVSKDGPYEVSGGVELAGVASGDGASKEHYTLCRCGASKNKPFCDGTHWTIEFKDPA